MSDTSKLDQMRTEGDFLSAIAFAIETANLLPGTHPTDAARLALDELRLRGFEIYRPDDHPITTFLYGAHAPGSYHLVPVEP